MSSYVIQTKRVLMTGHDQLLINDRKNTVTSWSGQKSVVSVVSCHFPNSITTCHIMG